MLTEYFREKAERVSLSAQTDWHIRQAKDPSTPPLAAKASLGMTNEGDGGKRPDATSLNAECLLLSASLDLLNAFSILQ